MLIKYIFVGLSTIAYLFVANTAVAEGKKISDYKKEIEFQKEWVKNLTKEYFYNKSFVFKDKKTDKIINFSKFENFNKKAFFLFSAQKLSNNLEKIQQQWLEKLEGLPSGKPNINDSKIANQADLNNLLDDLFELRKELAKKWEGLAEQIFSEYSSQFTEKERELYLRTMRDYNTNNKLIDRETK